MAAPRPLMESLIRPNLPDLQSPMKDDGGNKGLPSLLGQIPGSNTMSAAANFMGAVKALAFQKLTETPSRNKNQILNALFGNQGNNQGGGGGPQSLLGEPSRGMGFNAGQNQDLGDGLLPVPNQGQGQNMQNMRNNDYGYDGDYDGYDDSYQVC